MSFSLEEIDCANPLVFTDSPYFWNGLLDNLPNNLGKNGDVLDLGKEKGLYPCGCLNSFYLENFVIHWLPTKLVIDIISMLLRGPWSSCNLRLGLNFEVRLKKKIICCCRLIKNVHLRLLQPYGCSGANFTPAVNCANPKTETQSENTEIQVI